MKYLFPLREIPVWYSCRFQLVIIAAGAGANEPVEVEVADVRGEDPEGMPVVVYGRMRSREVERPCGDGSHTVRYQDIEAYAVGRDLARGTADFTRVKSASVAENETRVIADVMAAAAIAEEDGDDISGDTRDGQALASA